MQGVIVLCCIYVVLTDLKIINEVGIVQDYFFIIIYSDNTNAKWNVCLSISVVVCLFHTWKSYKLSTDGYWIRDLHIWFLKFWFPFFCLQLKVIILENVCVITWYILFNILHMRMKGHQVDWNLKNLTVMVILKIINKICVINM